MGHQAERSRGDSRLRDWPDVEWRIVRQDDDPARYIAAYGRDVEIPESRLDYDPQTRRCTLAGGSRRDARLDGALDLIVDVLAASSAPMSGRAIKDTLKDSDVAPDTLDAALAHGLRTDRLVMQPGPHRAKLYRCSSVRASGSVRLVSGAHSPERVSECPSASIEADTQYTPRPLTAQTDELVTGRTLADVGLSSPTADPWRGRVPEPPGSAQAAARVQARRRQ